MTVLKSKENGILSRNPSRLLALEGLRSDWIGKKTLTTEQYLWLECRRQEFEWSYQPVLEKSMINEVADQRP